MNDYVIKTIFLLFFLLALSNNKRFMPILSLALKGYLVKRWVRGCAAQVGCLFGLLGLPMAPYLFEN